MQIYILNRARETLATTASIYDDKHTMTLEAGSSSYEFTIDKSDSASKSLETGNYIVLQDDNGKTWLFTILDYEETHNTKTVYAEDAGIELINKAMDIWTLNGSHPFKYYFDLVTKDTPWTLGVNRLEGLSRSLKFDGRDTGLGRLLSILKAFDHAECSFDVTVKMNAPADFKINVYKQIGNDRSDVQIVYNSELDDIKKKESRAEFVTALAGVGGQIQSKDGTSEGNVDFSALEYNKDGFVTKKGDKFLRAVDANKVFNPGHESYIESFYEYDTQSPSELLSRTLSKLKIYSEPQYTYNAEVKVIDPSLNLGDTVTILDHDYNPALYLSARVAKMVKSYTDPTRNEIEFTNYRLLSSRLADKLARLQTIVNQMPSASQVGKLESNVSALSSKTDELASQITSANGKNTNYYGAVEPANPKNGDLWYKKLKSGETEMYQYQNGNWELITSTDDIDSVAKQVEEINKTVPTRKEVEEADKKLKDEFDAASALYKSKADAIEASLNGQQQDVDSLKNDVKSAQTEYDNLSKKVNDNKKETDADYAAVSGKLNDTTTTIVDVKKTVSSLQTTVADNTGNINTIKTDVAGTKQNIATAKGDITSIKADVSGVKTTVAGHTGKITQLTADVNGVKSSVSNKVDKTTYQSYVTQTDKALSAKLTASDLQGYAKTTDLETRAGKIEASLTSLQGDMSYKATTLVDKPEFSDGDVGGWVAGGKPAVLYKTGGVDGYHYSVQSQNIDNLYASAYWKPVASESKWYVEALIPNFEPAGGKNVYANASLYYIRPSDGKSAWSFVDCGAKAIAPQHWGWVKGYVTVPYGVTKVKPCISMKRADGTNIKSAVKYCQFTLVNAGVQNQLTTLSGKITATSDRLSSVYTKSDTDSKISTALNQSAAQITAAFTQNGKTPTLANLDSSGVYLKGKHIYLDGNTYITNGIIKSAAIADGAITNAKIGNGQITNAKILDATINSAKIASLDASKITTGTLNAAKVNLINVNASNISTGVLNGIKITSTGKDPSGRSSTTNIQSGYIDTNVINCSDYILVGKADADPRNERKVRVKGGGVWLGCPAKLNGHTGNSASDYQYEWQGCIRAGGWNWLTDVTETGRGTGESGVEVGYVSEQKFGRPYGGDYVALGEYVISNPRHNDDDNGANNATLDAFMSYSTTTGYKGKKGLWFYKDPQISGNLHVKSDGANHGIRTAWVSWSDWGSSQKIPCIVNDTNNWGGIAFPSNGRVVLFTHGARINTDKLPIDGKVYNGWGS